MSSNRRPASHTLLHMSQPDSPSLNVCQKCRRRFKRAKLFAGDQGDVELWACAQCHPALFEEETEDE